MAVLVEDEQNEKMNLICFKLSLLLLSNTFGKKEYTRNYFAISVSPSIFHYSQLLDKKVSQVSREERHIKNRRKKSKGKRTCINGSERKACQTGI